MDTKESGGLEMQCSCPDCGGLMAHSRGSVFGRCVCNWCQRCCDDCLGRAKGSYNMLKKGEKPSPELIERLMSGGVSDAAQNFEI
ncbi:MAG: hypothetical protein ACOYJD_05060 [Christensenellales bacterium]|jgi:hypothetical protein